MSIFLILPLFQLSSALSQNAVANYSQTGHELVEVAMHDSPSEIEQTFINPLGIPGTSSTIGMMLSTTQAPTRNKKEHPPTIMNVSGETEIQLAHQQDDKVEIDNSSEKTADIAAASQSTDTQVLGRTNVQKGNTKNLSCSDSEAEIEISDDHNALLLKRCNKQSDTLRKYKKKIDARDAEIAQLKDLVVHAVSEAKYAKEDPNAKQTFTPDEDLNITTADIEHINSLSKNVEAFGRNLAMHLYGADELCKRSVTGRNYKGLISGYKPKPAISPTKLNFSYNSARERIGLQVGNKNHEQISSLANKSLINRALAEKIANLNKARRTASLRTTLVESTSQ